ncbi:hypothetical protein T06_13945, partial [Trichinella sp. T6]
MRSNAVEVVFADCNEKKQSNLFTRIFMQIFIRGLDWYLGFEKSIISQTISHFCGSTAPTYCITGIYGT